MTLSAVKAPKATVTGMRAMPMALTIRMPGRASGTR